MPGSQNIQLNLGGRDLEVPVSDDLPISIDVEIEDEDNFEVKSGSRALNIEVPATLNNSRQLNTFFNPNSEDYSPDGLISDAQSVVLRANGIELIAGKAIISKGIANEKPKSFEIDIYGRNADWAIDNSELSLHDVVNAATHIYDLSTATIPGKIDTSWTYDGTDESEFFVYAPVRYLDTFGDDDTRIALDQLRPSLFLYWLLYAGFKNAGYKIQSNFLDTPEFRRLVLPWTWGNFLYIDSTELDVLRFKALNVASMQVGGFGATAVLGPGSTTIGETPFDQSNDSSNGGFDNAGTYSFSSGSGQMIWEYPSAFSQFGQLKVGFKLEFFWNMVLWFGCTGGIRVKWYIDTGSGWVYQGNAINISYTAPTLGSINPDGQDAAIFETPAIGPGSKVMAQVEIYWTNTIGTNNVIFINAFENNAIQQGMTFENTYFKIPIGGTVDFKKYPALKNYKWLDLLRGTIDMFNLSIDSDPIEKTVFIEPTHSWTWDSDLNTDVQPGFFNGELLNWTSKKDMSKDTVVENFSDFEQVFKIQLQEDENDGMYKLLRDRHKSKLTDAVYQFPSRFKKGVRELENRFFSAVMHYRHEPWRVLSGVAPQLICIIPENIANSSQDSAKSTFIPKLAYYKGQVPDTYGAWRLDSNTSLLFPFMFAVNYYPGGESDPVLTYCDQNIDGNLGFGSFKRFYWQRFAIMRHGKKVTMGLLLNNSDVLNKIHREYITIGQAKYQILRISGYKPLMNQTTECTFWLWYPITESDNTNTYPSEDSVLNGTPIVNTPDPKYNQLICLASDIP